VGIPFTGSDVESSALAMNKQVSRLLLAEAGVPVPRGCLVRSDENPDAGNPPIPAVVKPCRLGSSVGVSLVTDRASCARAVRAVQGMGQDCLIEEYVAGVEYSCPVWERRDGTVALPVIEIRPGPGRAFFDYQAKYVKGQACETVCTEDTPLFAQLKHLAERAHRALGCRSFSRTDFIVADGAPYALEVNTIPGLTANSLVPQALRAAGYSLADLVTESIEVAIADARS
jgi:D-alanine-D-alanine ligase